MTKKDNITEFVNKFDEQFGTTDENRLEVLDIIVKQLTDPVLNISMSIVPGRPPILASNIANNDPDQIEQAAETLDGVARELRQMAYQRLKRMVNGKEPATEGN